MAVFWADVLVAVHLAYVGFVIFGLLAIFAGLLLHWQWIRNPWFRWTHLVMICIVAGEAIVDFECPLTTWENNLRYRAWAMTIEPPMPHRVASWTGLLAAPMGNGSLMAGPQIRDTKCPSYSSDTFIGRCLDNVMFPGAPQWMLNLIYIGVALVVLVAFIFAPPRRRKKTPVPEPRQPAETV